MLKKNKFKVILSSIIILLPILFGIIMWNDLPNTMTTHWGADGNADGFSGKAFAVFGLPAILLALHLLCLILTSFDKNQKKQNPKALGMIFWIFPMISLLVSAITYSTALGKEINLPTLVPLILGVALIFTGNYMPKTKHNRTLGIKIYWTLNNEENWNKTHRFGGKIMVIGGFIMMLPAFTPFKVSLAVMLCVLACVAILPMLYSYFIYRQHKKEGILYAAAPKSKREKITVIISSVIISIIIIAITVVMFTGDIEVKAESSNLKINASYWTDLQIDYSEIDSIEYRKDLDIGIRTNGFSSARLLMGIFQNKEFGLYTLYSYAGAKDFVVLTSNEKTLVIGMDSTEETQAVYNEISSKSEKIVISD